MRLLAWNLNHRAKRRRIPDWIATAIAEQSPDVLVLTEYVEGPDHSSFLASLKAQGLGNCSITTQPGGENQLMIVSRDAQWRSQQDVPDIQVRGATLYRAKDYLDQRTIKGIPVFLCGGGMRMTYYRKLGEELKHFQGVSWLKATARPLAIPNNLQAPGLIREDYDRLSVAFGLSFLEVGSIVRELPKPIATGTQKQRDDDDRFISKDHM